LNGSITPLMQHIFESPFESVLQKPTLLFIYHTHKKYGYNSSSIEELKKIRAEVLTCMNEHQNLQSHETVMQAIRKKDEKILRRIDIVLFKLSCFASQNSEDHTGLQGLQLLTLASQELSSSSDCFIVSGKSS
jgi:hypothetical protein